MSYCRPQDGVSDVYLYPTADGQICCHLCKLPKDRGEGWQAEDVILADQMEALDHLALHQAAGQLVPHDAVARLRTEAVSRGHIQE